MAPAIVGVVIGLVVLMLGGDVLVRGAVRLAEKAGLSPLVVGLVVVGFGTSMPELVTSVSAALSGVPSVAWGNVAGSNMANSLLILGVAALVAPIALERRAALRDPLIGLIAALAVLVLGRIDWMKTPAGAALLVALAVYVVYCLRVERGARLPVHTGPADRAAALEMAEPRLHRPGGGWGAPTALTLAGLGLLLAGGRVLVDGAVELAALAGWSETLIGLTVVAIGTSLPELVTSLVAARRGQSGIAFGNIAGSNIYNLLGIGGATALLAPGALPADLLARDLWWVAAAAALMFGIAAGTGRFGRTTGAVLLAGYAAYLALLITSG